MHVTALRMQLEIYCTGHLTFGLRFITSVISFQLFTLTDLTDGKTGWSHKQRHSVVFVLKNSQTLVTSPETSNGYKWLQVNIV